MTRNVHQDVDDLMATADAQQETLGWSDDQKAVMRHFLELVWNRGYKNGYDAGVDSCAPTSGPDTQQVELEELARLNRKGLRTGMTVEEADRRKELAEKYGL